MRVQLGVNMPAQANRKVKQEETDTDPSEVELFEVYDVVLYLGIIDILKSFFHCSRLFATNHCLFSL